MRVGGFGVIDPEDTVVPGDELDAVVPRQVVQQALADGGRLDAVGPDQGRRCQGVGHHVARSDGAEVRHGRQFGGAVLALGDEGAVHQEALDDAEHADGRRDGGEGHRPAAFDDVGVLHHAFGFDLLGVVDARLLGVFVDLGLVRQVRRVGAVPVHVVLGDVEADARHRGDGIAPVQLEAGEFDGEDVVVHRIAQGVQDGCADVADGDGLEPGGLQHRFGQADGGGLSVRAGDGQPVRGLASLAFPDPPREFDVAPDRDVGPGCGGEQGLVRPPARGGDDQVRLCAVDFGDGVHGVLAQQDVGGPDDPQGVRLGLAPSVPWRRPRRPRGRQVRSGCRRRRSRRPRCR